MKTGPHSCISPYTGVCLLIVPIQVIDPYNQKEFVQLYEVTVKLDESLQPTFMEMPKQSQLLPGGFRVKY